jgi:hypothetical protein
MKLCTYTNFELDKLAWSKHQTQFLGCKNILHQFLVVASLLLVVGLEVLDGGPVAVLVGHVLDHLGAAVGKQHAVLAGDNVALAALHVSELLLGGGVVHLVLELVAGGLLK